MREASNLSLSESLVFSPHMHAVFHSYITKDMVVLPLVTRRVNLYTVEITDSAENKYYIATLYHGREATPKQIDDALNNLTAILTLRFA